MKPFDDVDLASHILRMVPRHWQDQYELTGATVPQSVCKLLEALEHIKKAFPSEKECKRTQKSVNGGGSPKKEMVAFSDQVPKKLRMDVKHYTPLCKQHGGAHNIHNTTECCKHEKDRTPKKAFIGKKACSTISTISTVRTCHVGVIIPMHSCLQK